MVCGRVEAEPDKTEVEAVEENWDDFDSVGVPHARMWSRSEAVGELVCHAHGLPVSRHG